MAPVWMATVPPVAAATFVIWESFRSSAGASLRFQFRRTYGAIAPLASRRERETVAAKDFMPGNQCRWPQEHRCN